MPTRILPRAHAAAAIFFVSLAGAAATGWTPTCDEVRDGTYHFENLAGSKNEPVQIFVCTTVECRQPSLTATVTQNAYSMARPRDLARPYFLLVRQKERRIVGARRLALEGAYNFRDLGGIETRDGKRTRWGRIFRSDVLSHLTAADYERLNAMGISLVCDLRTREERKSDPTEWMNGNPLFLLAPVSETAQGASRNSELTEALRGGTVSLDAARDIFEGFYVKTILDSAPKFGAVLRAIETSDGASLFHCQGGRDRTGMTAALLLTMLGVSEERIAQDYVLSTQYLNERPAGPAPTDAQRFQTQATELQPRYIQAIFRAIHQKYGSFERYRREALSVSDSDVEKLKARFLE